LIDRGSGTFHRGPGGATGRAFFFFPLFLSCPWPCTSPLSAPAWPSVGLLRHTLLGERSIWRADRHSFANRSSRRAQSSGINMPSARQLGPQASARARARPLSLVGLDFSGVLYGHRVCRSIGVVSCRRAQPVNILSIPSRANASTARNPPSISEKNRRRTSRSYRGRDDRSRDKRNPPNVSRRLRFRLRKHASPLAVTRRPEQRAGWYKPIPCPANSLLIADRSSRQ